MKIKFTYICGT